MNQSQLLSPPQIKEAARLFGILSDASRLSLLKALMEKEKTVTELVGETGLSQANVSKHLAILHSGHFLNRRKSGLFVYYSVEDPSVKELCKLICDRMAREAERISKELSH